MIGSIILAAGASRRMGFPKLKLELEGKSLLEQVIIKARSLTSEVLVVVGAYASDYRSLAEKAGARVIDNPDWQEGLGSSLRLGIGGLAPETELALVLLADQPFIPAAHLKALLAKQRESGAELVFSGYEGIQGPPVVIAKALFAKAALLQGDKGAKALVNDSQSVTQIALEHYQDIDTPEDATRFLVD